MMALWNAQEIAAATGGTLTADFQAHGVSINTRTLKQGDLFVALCDQRDGHDFIADAFLKGASGALVSRIPGGVEPTQPLVVVDDVMAALTRLAHLARARTGAQVLAVTGSVGKTTTKEMLRTVLARQGRTHASVASYNNHWGVPLSLVRMPQDTEFAIFEIGMNAPGEIAPLSQMVQPHCGLITWIAPAHMAAFENLESIAAEKAEIAAGLGQGGIMILPADSPCACILIARAQKQGATLLGFGKTAQDFRLLRADQHGDCIIAHVSVRGQPCKLHLNTLGTHFVHNAMGVLAAVEALGGNPQQAALDLACWTPADGRGARYKIEAPACEFELIDDAYNANPVSVVAALEMLAQSATRGRRVAILGDMLELGVDTMQYHTKLAQEGALQHIDYVHCIGPQMKALHSVLPASQRGLWSASAQEFLPNVANLFQAGDLVLVKASLGTKLALVVDAIRKLGHP